MNSTPRPVALVSMPTLSARFPSFQLGLLKPTLEREGLPAQRRLRQQLVRHNETLPNQIPQPTQRPTLRWAFQLLEGLHRVRVTVQGQVHDLLEGFTEVKLKVLRFFGEGVCRLYQISPA